MHVQRRAANLIKDCTQQAGKAAWDRPPLHVGEVRGARHLRPKEGSRARSWRRRVPSRACAEGRYLLFVLAGCNKNVVPANQNRSTIGRPPPRWQPTRWGSSFAFTTSQVSAQTKNSRVVRGGRHVPICRSISGSMNQSARMATSITSLMRASSVARTRTSTTVPGARLRGTVHSYAPELGTAATMGTHPLPPLP
jgi:hypothetical protein